VLDRIMNVADDNGQALITLVRCMGGENLMAVVQPYYTQVRACSY
jgi:hypothetical protein